MALMDIASAWLGAGVVTGARSTDSEKDTPELRRVSRNELFDENDQLRQGLSFDRCVFDFAVVFNEITVTRGLSFSNCKFNYSVSGRNLRHTSMAACRFQFVNCDFHGSVDFRGASLYGPDFSESRFHRRADFKSATFYPQVKFDGCSFLDIARFSECRFQAIANFSGVRFLGSANFNRSVFDRHGSHARFSEVEFHKVAEFESAVMVAGVDFSNAVFHNGADFSLWRCAWRASAEANVGKFEPLRDGDPRKSRAVCFRGARFASGEGQDAGLLLSFRAAQIGTKAFPRDIDLSSVKIRKRRIAPGTGNIDFDLSDVVLRGDLDLSNAEIVVSSINMGGAIIDGTLGLRSSTLRGELRADTAVVSGRVDLESMSFEEIPDLRGLSGFESVNFYEAKLPELKEGLSVRRRSELLSRLSRLKELAAQYHSRGFEASVRSSEIQLNGAGLSSFLYRLSSNYGTSWARPLFILVFVTLVVFPLGYLSIKQGGNPLTVVASCFSSADENTSQSNCRSVRSAVGVSIKRTVFVSFEDESSSKEVRQVLGAGVAGSVRWFQMSFLEAVQTILAIALVFLMAAAIRRRLLLR